MKPLIFLFYIFSSSVTSAQDVAILKYDGGGDWYANPTAIPNLVAFANTNLKTNISKNPQNVAINSSTILTFLSYL